MNFDLHFYFVGKRNFSFTKYINFGFAYVMRPHNRAPCSPCNLHLGHQCPVVVKGNSVPSETKCFQNIITVFYFVNAHEQYIKLGQQDIFGSQNFNLHVLLLFIGESHKIIISFNIFIFFI